MQPTEVNGCFRHDFRDGSKHESSCSDLDSRIEKTTRDILALEEFVSSPSTPIPVHLQEILTHRGEERECTSDCIQEILKNLKDELKDLQEEKKSNDESVQPDRHVGEKRKCAKRGKTHKKERGLSEEDLAIEDQFEPLKSFFNGILPAEQYRSFSENLAKVFDAQEPMSQKEKRLAQLIAEVGKESLDAFLDSRIIPEGSELTSFDRICQLAQAYRTEVEASVITDLIFQMQGLDPSRGFLEKKEAFLMKCHSALLLFLEHDDQKHFVDLLSQVHNLLPLDTYDALLRFCRDTNSPEKTLLFFDVLPLEHNEMGKLWDFFSTISIQPSLLQAFQKEYEHSIGENKEKVFLKLLIVYASQKRLDTVVQLIDTSGLSLKQKEKHLQFMSSLLLQLKTQAVDEAVSLYCLAIRYSCEELKQNSLAVSEIKESLLKHINICEEEKSSLIRDFCSLPYTNEATVQGSLPEKIQDELQKIDALIYQDLNRIFRSENPQIPLFFSQFSEEQYKKGLEGLEAPPGLPPDVLPLHTYVDELWNTLFFDPVEVFSAVQKENGEESIQKTPEEAKRELKNRLDTFISNIENKVRILGAGAEKDKTYDTITLYLANIFQKLKERGDPNLTLKVLRDCIEASGHCQMRYLEVSELNYLPVCLGVQRNARQSFFTLCADMRDLCAREVVAEEYEGDVHALNMAKKEVGERLGIPGWKSIIQDDLFPGEALERGYTKEGFTAAFLRKYTPEALVNNYFSMRLSSNPDDLSLYFRLYEELFPLSKENLPLFFEHQTFLDESKDQLPEEQKQALSSFLEGHDIIPVQETTVDTFDRVYRALASYSQQKQVLLDKLSEKYKTVQNPSESADQETARIEKDNFDKELSFGLRCLQEKLQKTLHTDVSFETLPQLHASMLPIQKMSVQEKELALSPLFSQYPTIFQCRHQTEEEALKEALLDEHQDAVRSILLEERDGSFVPKLQPMIEVVKRLGIIEPCTERISLLDDLDSQSSKGYTLATRAVQNDNCDMIRLLHDLGVNLNACDRTGYSPFALAVEKGNIPMVRLLHELGADINAHFSKGWTPLSMAATTRNLNMIDLLVRELGADINAFIGKWPLLCHMIARDDSEIVRKLCQLGADVNMLDKEGRLPLMRAIEKGNIEIVRMLVLEFGAKINEPDAAGMTPRMVAEASGNSEIIEFLEEVLGGA